jgi:hypothetical protein
MEEDVSEWSLESRVTHSVSFPITIEVPKVIAYTQQLKVLLYCWIRQKLPGCLEGGCLLKFILTRIWRELRTVAYINGVAISRSMVASSNNLTAKKSAVF